MASAISATQSAPYVNSTIGQILLQAGKVPVVTGSASSKAGANYADAPDLTPNPPTTALQVQAQLAGAEIGPEGRLMQLLRTMIPPVPPPLIPPTKNVQA
jgi:hypothetical protein